ncbi:MAG: ABC transporter permease, partial [Acetobacteraceae bacterium]
GPFNVLSMGGVIFVIGMHAFAFPFFLTETALRSVDARFEESAQILGARRLTVARRITLPIVAPAVTGGALLAAVDSMALFGPQAFLGLPARLVFLPTRIYGVLGSYPPRFADASVLSLILVLFTVLGLLAQRTWLARRSYVTVSGRGVRAGRVPLGRLRPWLLAFCLLAGLLAVLAPLGVLLVASVSVVWTSPPAPGNLTLAHYATALFGNQVSVRGILNSFRLAAMAGVIASLLGLAIAYLNLRTHVRGRRFLDYLAVLPLGLPGTVMAVGVLQAFIRPPLRLYGTIWILLVAYIARFIPLSVQSADATLRQIDPGLEEAARITGASWFASLRRVVLPMVRPGLATAFMLVFIPALNELSATILLYSSGTETISVAIYRLNDLGQLEVVAALAVFSIAVILLVSLALHYFVGRGTPVASEAEPLGSHP